MKKMFAVLLLFVCTAAFANPNTPQDCPQRFKVMEDLKLNDAQKEQFEKISYDMEKKQIELRSKLETAQLDLRRLMDANSPDKSAIEKKFNEIAAAQTALKMNHVNCWFEKNKVLTPEQQKIWKQTLSHRMKKGHMMMRNIREGKKDRMRIERRIMMRDENDEKDRD